jgi:hypothetical protein
LHERFDQQPPNTLNGLAGSVGGRTPIGPFIFMVGWVGTHSRQLQVSLGRLVAEGTMLDDVQ